MFPFFELLASADMSNGCVPSLLYRSTKPDLCGLTAVVDRHTIVFTYRVCLTGLP